MKRKVCLLVAVVVYGLGVRAQEFDNFFEAKRLRVDFALSGDAKQQSAALMQIREEPVWDGPTHNLVDTFGYGGYYVNVYDKVTQQLIYSRGFCTLFEEWQTTAAAKQERQSWTNSVTTPFPKKEITLEITGRDKADMQFYPLLRIDIDPASIFIDRGKLPANRITQIQYEGAPEGKVDLVFLAEGYTAAEQDKFVSDARRFAQSLFDTPPYDARRNDFNVWAVGLVSEEAGTDNAGKGVFKQTALNSGYYTFGLDRYLTTPDMKAIRDAVWNVPCDAIFILVNADTYGGGGIYNFYAMGTADNERTVRVFVHELGHSFAGLADEYFSTEVAYDETFYNLTQEPWEPNITTLVNFASKWQTLLESDTPVPTPADGTYTGKVGVFEGGGYLSKGIYRPAEHCTMRDYAPFCPVCSRAILRMIDFLSDKE